MDGGIERLTTETLPAVAWMEAFAKAQAEFPAIHKDKTAKIKTKAGGEFSYSYADLPTILEAVNPILQKHNLAVGQSVVSINGGVGVETRIYHTGGHVERFGPLYLPGGDDARSAGSSVTYSRRYSLCAALGIATDEDNDGATASPKPARSESAPARSRSEAPQASDPYCPACYHINGEIVGVWENDTAPFWKCKNSPKDCAGAAPDKKGKVWQWSGWDKDWQRAHDDWVEANIGKENLTREDSTPDVGEWMANAVQAFTKWSDEQRRGAYKAVMEDLEYESLESREQAEAVFEGMAASYYVEFPQDGPF